jgi:hypothetical protein
MDKYLIVKEEVDSSIWSKIKDLAKGNSRERIKAVGLLFDNYRVIPDEADGLLLSLAEPKNSVQVRREIAKRLAKKYGIPWVLHVGVLEVLSRDKDKEVQGIVQPIFEPYKKINDYFSRLAQAWSAGMKGWSEVFKSVMPPALDKATERIWKEVQLGNFAQSIENLRKTSLYLKPDLILPIAKQLDSVRISDINRIYADSVLNITNSLAKNSLQLVPSYSYSPTEPEFEETGIPENPLISKLRSIRPGKRDWNEYQKVCQEIMSYCFVPPLMEPYTELEDEAGIHRRDIVYPIPGGIESFWGFIQRAYSATGVVVDAKNYGNEIPPNQIVIVSKYFGRRKLGNFGIIISRKGPSDYAKKEQIDRWVHGEEMIVCLSDNDIQEMVRVKQGNGEAWSILDKKIFEIRKSA